MASFPYDAVDTCGYVNAVSRAGASQEITVRRDAVAGPKGARARAPKEGDAVIGFLGQKCIRNSSLYIYIYSIHFSSFWREEDLHGSFIY